MLTYQKVELNDLHIFTRDLSERVNVNLKNKIEDFNKKKDKSNDIKGKKHIKKKDIIIQKQNELRLQKNINRDEKLMDNFFKNINDSKQNVYNFLNFLKTDNTKLSFKFKMLEYYFNKKNIKQCLSLYFELNDKGQNEKHNSILLNIKEKISKYEYNLYMLKNLGDILPPLNFWNQEFKFDDWQIEAQNTIKSKQCLIIKAPTSSGKSFVACSAAIFHNKILYICPSEPVAYQIGSQFIKMNYRVHFLLENVGHIKYDDKCNIFIGTPEYIENFLYKIDTKFDYAVFDEIHDINYSYENLLKIIDCNFLALSATINNINDFEDLFKKINPNKKIKKIEYNKRFINIQRWVWTNNTIKKIHPIECFKDITKMKNNDLKMTPSDIALLWETLESVFDENEYDESFDIHDSLVEYIENLSPDNYFLNNTKLLTLNNVHEYEKYIIENILYLNIFYPEKIKKVVDKLSLKDKKHTPNIIEFLNVCKKKELFPMLVFNSSDVACTNIFNDIYKKLIELEETNYPHHYDILEKKHLIYSAYIEKKKIYSENIKIPKKTNAQEYIKTKLELFDSQNKNIYINTIIEYYNSLIDKIKNSNIDENLKEEQVNNLNTDLYKFIQNPDFFNQDIYKKHENYCYNISEPMSSNKIREIKKKISKSLGKNISYEHPIFQMLKRGIGLYTENLPEQYRRLLQTLLINKDIGIVICGKMLSMGIDMPIKTSCLMGYPETTFSSSDYFQMSGRSGRRGHDTSGNVIFYNIDYDILMKSELPHIVGSNEPLYTHYKYLKNIKNINIQNVFTNFLNKDRQIINTNVNNNLTKNESIIIWNLRKYKNYDEMLSKLQHTDYYKMIDINDKEGYIFECISLLLFDKNIIKDYKINKFNIYFKEILNIVIVLYNNTNDKNEPLMLLYEKLKNIIFKNNGFL
tara:strand:- start:695 stop:3451 length:2757 start_codon:yes stop_codon:yes gene_type:complete